ncbi:MAG: 2-dehydro-3-deoxyglucarate aldolase [Candidatus Omnitrophica bacterium]|nr:2-dehydro-3-deoxyglucarate aldolase [Candidatus Omnitrophota bacterium]
MKWIRERVLQGELFSGTFLNLGSSLTAEIAGQAGFDYVLIDLEHGSGDHDSLLVQLQAVDSTPAATIVRVAWNDPVRIKRVLDLGPSGIMVPMVNTAEEAQRAVSAMKYPPVGIRGVAASNRACRFGPGFDDYFSQANDNLLTVVQIETPVALENIESIADVEGVDVLFVGPSDLSVSLGIGRQVEHPEMREAYSAVIAAAKGNGKAAGILVQTEEQLAMAIDLGFTFISLSSDAGEVAKGLYSNAACFNRYRNR